MDLGLKGKSVLITGASKGIGLACARAFAAEGANIHLAARSADLLEQNRKEIAAKYGVSVTAHVADLRAPGSAKKLVQACGKVDILVNNAGDIPGGSIEGVDEEKWRHAWELKVYGFINMTREMVATMSAQKSGVIFNVIGMAGVTHPDGYICGAAGNAALDAFTRGVGKGTTKNGVRVLGLHPGMTMTGRVEALNRGIAKQKFGDEGRWMELVDQSKVQQPEQVADTVVFLCSARASHLSGVMLNLNP